MAPAEALHLAAKFEIPPDLRVIQDAEAVDDGDGVACHFDDLVGIEFQIRLMADGQDYRISPLQGVLEVGLNPYFGELVLIPEEPRPGVARGGVGFLFLQFPPVLHVRVVYANLGPHFSQLPDQRLGAAVAGVAHVLPVGGAEEGDLRSGDDLPHVPKGVPDELRHVEGAGVVDVDRKRRDLEDVVLKAHEGPVGPDAQAAILGEAVAADPRTGEDHVGMGGADLDRLDHLDQVHAVSLGKEAPFVEEGQDRRPVGVLDDLAGLAFDRAVQDRQGKFLDVQDLGEELHNFFFRRLVDPAADPPEVPDGGDVLPLRHDPKSVKLP